MRSHGNDVHKLPYKAESHVLRHRSPSNLPWVTYDLMSQHMLQRINKCPLSHVRRQTCHVRAVEDRQRHTSLPRCTCKLFTLTVTNDCTMGISNTNQGTPFVGESASLSDEQKSVDIASHTLECRCLSSGQSLPMCPLNNRSSGCPRSHDTTPKNPPPAMLASQTTHPSLTELSGVSRTIESDPIERFGLIN